VLGRIIEWCAAHRLTVFGAVLALAAWSVVLIDRMPLDALPDLTDPQVIVFTEWMGRNPEIVEDQITYPLVRALRSTPGGVKTVRGYSMFGMSFIYVVFPDGTDLYWARTRVSEILPRVAMPPDVTPVLGPDATGSGWVFEYVLVDDRGEHDLAELRALQDFTIRPALQSVPGVSEVASLGGFERQLQVTLDPERLASFGLSVADIARAVTDSNYEVGARVIESSGSELLVRGRGYARELGDVESSVVSLGAGGNPIRVRDVARVAWGPDIRRGAADWNGRGERVGGIVVMRMGQNALDVIAAVRERMAELSLPPGVRFVPTYDRSDLIEGSVDTLTNTLIQEGIFVALVCLLFLFHFRSAFVAIIVMPTAALLSFIPMYYFGLTASIMSLAGIAIAIGELEDASTTFVEAANVRLASADASKDRTRIVIDAIRSVARPTFYSLLIVTVSFIPIFSLTGQAGRLFRPLALTHTFSTFAAALLSITLVPALMPLLMRGRFRTEEQNPITRWLGRAYRPVVRGVVRFRYVVLALAATLFLATIPVALRIGSEFMPPLDEGSLLVMPTTFSGISIEQAREILVAQDRAIAAFREVESVHGKVGRAETATDPAQLDMIETVIALGPRERWPLLDDPRWWSGHAPRWLEPPLRLVWPDRRRRTVEELSSAIAEAVATPGFQIAIAPPIRTRIDMLTTGVRTPVGLKVLGDDLAEIERISVELESILRDVPGTRSTFAERQSGRPYLDVIPDREAIARYGLTVREVNQVIEAAVGGMTVSTIVDGRARYSMNVRFGSDFRGSVDALRALRIAVRTSGSAATEGGAEMGGGRSSSSDPSMSGGMGTPSAGSSGEAIGGMGGGAGGSATPQAGATTDAIRSGAADSESLGAFAPDRPSVPLGSLASIEISSGAPMIRDEDGVLAGYVYADIDLTTRDLGGYVDDAKRLVDERLELPAGYRLVWTGQYELLEEMRARMMWIVPLAIGLVVVLLRRGLRGWGQTTLVLTTIPFGLIGSIWLLYERDYNTSVAVWVGLIAVLGTASETGILMTEFLDESVGRKLVALGKLGVPDLHDAIIDGAARRVRPIVMSSTSTVLGLLPLLWESGPGADVSARIAAPLIGGIVSCFVLTVLVIPAVYTVWRDVQLRRGRLDAAALGVEESAVDRPE